MVLDMLFGWSLQLPLWQGILALAAIVTVLMNVVYYFATDQKEMKRLKSRIKEKQEEMRSHRDNPKKASQIQKQLLKINGEYTKKSIKPTLYTLIPILFVFGWMAANLAFAPIMPGESVSIVVEMDEPARMTLSGQGIDISGDSTKETIERQARWSVSAQESTTLTIITQDGDQIQRELQINSRQVTPQQSHDAPFSSSEIKYPKATPFGDFSIFGYRPGWLMTYIVFSIVLSIFIRKAFKIS